MQLTGAGSAYESFTWAAEAVATYNNVNNGQVFLPLQDIVFINELHYDNEGIDAGEGVTLLTGQTQTSRSRSFALYTTQR